MSTPQEGVPTHVAMWELSPVLQEGSFSGEANNLGLCVKCDFKAIATHSEFSKTLNGSLKSAIDFYPQFLSFT